MYNAFILNALTKEFGEEKMKDFCKIEAGKYSIIALSYKDGSFEAQEAWYESTWWETAASNIEERIKIGRNGEIN